MTRFQRVSPILLGALMAACSEAQPYVQPVAPIPGQAVVVDAGLGDRTAKLDLRAMAAYALQATGSPSPSTVHRWVPADLVRYDVELRVRNATTATQYDAVGAGLTAQVPVNGQGAGSATFTKLRQGGFYRAYVKAMGKAGGASAQGTEVQMNAQATNDHVDFDFTAANDVAQEVSRTVTVTFDGVAFSGTGAITFGSPSPGAYVGPSDGPAVAVSNPPEASPSVSPSPRPLQGLSGTFTVGTTPWGVAVDAQGNAWVANTSSGNLTKFNSSGAFVGTYTVGSAPRYLAVDASGNVWVANYNSNSVTKLTSNGSAAGTYTVGTKPQGVAVDPQGNVWVANTDSNSVTRLASNGSAAGTYTVGSNPQGIAVDAAGNVWVANYNSSNVTKLASDGTVLGTYSPGGTFPAAVAVDAQGNVWVANQSTSTVGKLASTGSLLTSRSVPSSPIALAVDGEGRIWVGHQGNGLTVLSSDLGTVLSSHALTVVYGIAVSTTGQVWATRFANNSVSLFS